LFTIAALCLTIPAFAQDTGATAVIWIDRGAATLDLSSGPGGKDLEPGREFKFLKESRSGTSPKFDVEDERGVTWAVKLGEEARSETAAARLLWAAGYVVDEDYYRATMRVYGLPRLARGRKFVTDGDTVTGARLERDTPSEGTTTWSWYDNPFVGTREFNGLRVMMALINNWDLKEVNNGTTGTSGGGGQYGITDLGATLGRTGNVFGRSKGVLRDYAGARFIEKVTPTYVDFRMNTRPSLLTILHVRNYRFRTRMESVAKNIPIADARWIGDRLGQLSAAQIGDGFRAAGYSPADVEGYTRVVIERIAVLRALGTVDAAAPVGTDIVVDRCLESTCRHVPLRETLTAIGVGTPYARAIFGGFEQGVGIGGGVQLTSAGAIPAVEFRMTALTATRRSERVDLEAFLPNIRGSRNHADAWFSYVQRDTAFFGIGPRSADLKTEFAIERRSYQGSLYRDLADRVQGGVYAQLMNARSVLAGQATGSNILSYGGFLAYDTRDNRIGLTRGVNLFGRAVSADGLGRREGLADYGWIETELDARAYVPLGSPRTSLLARARGQFKTPKDGRHIPYYDLSWLGGRQYLRGHDSYRFRDNHVLLVSTELQRTVRAMTGIRGIDAFISADAGQVWGGQEFTPSHWRSGLGGGLQYRHSRSIAARVEVSRGHERTVVYASLSRGF
jgi:hypothetical protein